MGLSLVIYKLVIRISTALEIKTHTKNVCAHYGREYVVYGRRTNGSDKSHLWLSPVGKVLVFEFLMLRVSNHCCNK